VTKYAVVIGTNYEGASYQLSGCVNDAYDWTALLATTGHGVTPLIGRDATRSAILAELDKAVTRARWGDRIVVTYSGHGTWVPDYDGDELDGRDEAWCPDDMQTAGLITDDDLSSVFKDARTGVGILVLSDSCFSGTMTRLLGDEAAKGVKFLPPYMVTRAGDVVRTAEAETRLPVSRTYTDQASLISGCAEPEVSYDAWFGRRANGAFTRAAIDAYRQGMSLAAWHNAIRDVLPSGDYPQSPQLVPASPYRRYAKAL
jgi:hypothetical protein